MWIHTNEKHGGVRGQESGLLDYRGEVLSSFQYPLDRQQEEGLRIKEDSLQQGVETLNGQQEYFKPEYIKFSWSK